MTETESQGFELPEISINDCIHNSMGMVISDRSIHVRGKTLKACIKCIEYLKKNKYISSRDST